MLIPSIVLVVLTVILLPLYYRLLFVIGKKYEESVMESFNKKWRPTYYVIPGPGSRLEKVILGDKEATVDWKMKQEIKIALDYVFIKGFNQGAKVFFLTLIVFFVLNPTVRLSQNLFWPLLIGYAVFMFYQLYLVYLPFDYWVKEWERRMERMVVFTDRVVFLRAKALPYTLLFPSWVVKITPKVFLNFFKVHKGQDSFKSENTITVLGEETLVATDPRQLSAKPPEMSDLEMAHIRGLAEERGVGNIKWPSRIIGATDYTWFIAHADGIRDRVLAIVKQGKRNLAIFTAGEKAEIEALLGKPAEAWVANKSLMLSHKVRDRVLQLFPNFKAERIECFSVEDPGLYRDDGSPTSESVLNYGFADTDVSEIDDDEAPAHLRVRG